VNSLRFQVLAVVSVTVALVLGALVGGAVRHSPPTAAADQVDALQARNQALQAQLRQLATAPPTSQPPAPVAAEGVEQLAPGVLDHGLAGVSVLVLSTQGGVAAVPGVAHMLDLAGADVVGQLQLSDAFSDPGHAADLLDLATASWPRGVAGGLPATSDGVVAASALLADVLYSPTVDQGDRRDVLTAYATRGYLTGVGTVSGPADAVVLVTGGPAGPTDALYTLVVQLHQVGPVVVAARQEQSTVVGRVRADTDLNDSVSTVDNVGSEIGPLVCAWALVDALAGHTGAYGEGTLPPAVSPSVTPSATATPTPTTSPTG
jgi:hypothetical protein